MSESLLLSIEEKLLVLTPEVVRTKIEKHEKQLKLWRAILSVLVPSTDPVASQSDKVTQPPVKRSSREQGNNLLKILMERGPMTTVAVSNFAGIEKRLVYASLHNLKKMQRVIYDGTVWTAGQSAGAT